MFQVISEQVSRCHYWLGLRKRGRKNGGSAHHRSVLCDRSPRRCPRRRCSRMECMGWGVWRGGGAGRERELSDRHCRPYAARKQQKSLSTFPVWKKKKKGGLQQLWWTKNGAVRFAHTLSKMSSTEATPERMVGVQQRELTCSSYEINALNKVRLSPTHYIRFNF